MKEKSTLKEVFFVSAIPGITGGIMNLILYHITTNGPIQAIPLPLCVIAAFYFFAQQKISTQLHFIKSFCIGFISSLFFNLFNASNAFYFNHYGGGKNLPITFGDFRIIIFPIIVSAFIGLLYALCNRLHRIAL